MNISQRMIHEIEHIGWENPTSIAKKLQDAYLAMFEKLKQGDACYIGIPLWKINNVLEEAGFPTLTPREFREAMRPPKKRSLRKRKTDNHRRLRILDIGIFYDNR